MMAAAVTSLSAADSCRYITAETLRQRLNDGPPLLLVDLSPEVLFARKHIPGSIPTGAYPLQTPAQLARLDAVLPRLEAATEDIVLICPRGGQTALRAVQYIQSKGVDPARLLILKNGILGWPYAAVQSATSGTLQQHLRYLNARPQLPNHI